MKRGSLIIVSGPSGAGKSALVGHVLAAIPNLEFSVSYTTRAPRGSERDGVEYVFVDRTEFEARIAAGDLLEWAEVHGNYYGTSRRFVDGRLERGSDVILDIDVQGAGIIRRERPEAVGIFVMPPSFGVLRERLTRRSLDDADVIRMRLERACGEISRYHEYDYLIVNDGLEAAVRDLEAIILSTRRRMSVMTGPARSIMQTFGGTHAEDP